MDEKETLDDGLFEAIEERHGAKNYVEVINTYNIITFGLMKSILRQNEVHFIVRDELTVQTDPFLSNAIGGAKIMVRSEDFEYATALLEEGGYNVKESGKMTEPISGFTHSIANGIPFLKDLRPELQMITIFGTAAILFAFIAYLILNAFGFLEMPAYY